ncbi:hypothetical protein AB0K35_28375 [Micromonospora sp. NPDC053740]|uniref:hypothetical protein n=1 Tax=Micromonospora sp. NPDC053740 TaxID=3155173 RepID=UPI003441BAD5
MRLSQFPLHQQAIPTDRVTFADGSTSDYNPPFMTVDPRYANCSDHHVGCDCREAHLREDILEFKIEEQIWRLAAEDIVGNHPQDTCMCTGCQIIRHRNVISKRLVEKARQ